MSAEHDNAPREHEWAANAPAGVVPSTVVANPVCVTPAPSQDASQRGPNVGRYLVLEEIGDGGTDVVLRAYDPRLQREVALKSVRTQELSAKARGRMLREAQAMAKLSHPNVVTLYDAEVMGDDVVIAMEYVGGTTLEQWLARAGRSWQEVLDAFICAGRGLAAAHAAGLVHRDFEPANVLVGEDGRVRVTGFSLAQRCDVTPAVGNESDGGAATDATDRDTASEPTNDGGAASLGPAMDQYAFCVALWEGLTGQRLLEGEGHPVLANTGRQGPREVALPKQIVAAVRRGLAAQPSERWPTMEALLEALAYDPRQRRRMWAVATSVLATLGASGTAWSAWHEQQTQRCSGAQVQLVDLWGATRRDAVAQAVLNAGAAYAEGVWKRVAPKLDAYAAGWAAMHTEACEATTVRGEQSPEVMDLRMACLHRAKVEFSAVADLLAKADAQVVEKAHQVVEGLPKLERCADAEALRAGVPPPADADADAVEAVRVQLAEVKVLRKAGKYPDAMARMELIAGQAKDISYAPLNTEVMLELGYARDNTGEHVEAEVALKETLRSGLRCKQWTESHAAASRLINNLGYRQSRPVEALAFAETAQGLLSSLADRDDNAAVLQRMLADVFWVQGRLDEAEARLRAELALREKALGPEHREVAGSRNNLAVLLNVRGRHREAERELRAGLIVLEKALGPDHPGLAMTRNNLGATLQTQGRYREAETEYLAALIVLEKALGPEHPDVAILRSNMGAVLEAQGRYQDAETEHRAVLALRKKVLGPDHHLIAVSGNNLGLALAGQGRSKEAEVEFRAALALFERLLGGEHHLPAGWRSNLGSTLHAQGRYEEAEAEYRKALRLQETLLGPEHADVARTRYLLAVTLAEVGEPDEASRLLEQAWEISQEAAAPAKERAEVAFALARLLWDAKTERPRARELAQTARDLYSEARTFPEGLSEVEAWLQNRELDSRADG